MFNTLLTLLVLVFISVSAFSCARDKQTTEPATAPPSRPSIGGGGPATTIIPSNPEENFKNAVLNADLIVSGTITGQRYEVVTVAPKAPGVPTGKYAYTIFTLTIDKVIKGDVTTKEVFIKAPGGYIGEIYQVPTDWYFKITDQVLLSLNRETDNVFKLSSPSLVWIRGPTAISEPDLPEVISRVIKIMKANSVPITLPESEWPPLIKPAEPVKRPEK